MTVLVLIIAITAWVLIAKVISESKTNKRKVHYISPEGKTYELFEDMLKQPHVLIAGATGSGKSVVINGLISTMLYRCPVDGISANGKPGAQMILIDPKRVELAAYKDMPHTLAHAAGFNPSAWMQALKQAITIMDKRYEYMERKGLKKYDKGDLYVVIDEWANVYKNGGKDAYKAVLRLTSEGRAAKVHLIMATQVPKANIIPTEIRENFDARVCLRTANAIQSRVIMEENGCEALPRYGKGYYVKPEGTKLWSIPYVKDDEIEVLLNWWNDPKHKEIV